MFRKLLCWLGNHILVISYEEKSLYDFVNYRNPTPEQLAEPRAYYATIKVEKCLCCKYKNEKIINKRFHSTTG